MQWLWEKFVEQWPVVKSAPAPFALALLLSSILVGIVIFYLVVWFNKEKVETQEKRIALLTERLDEQRKATENVARPKIARAADLRLLIYNDERNPTKISETNIWRWVWIKHIDTGVTTGGTITRVTTLNILFISFETQMTTSAVDIRSPDFTVPPYEVNSFYPRFAIISFQGKMPAGILEISMRP